MIDVEALLPELPPPYKFKRFEIENGQYISFEQYLEMYIEGGYLEWEDGRVVGFMPNNLKHQLLLNFLISVVSLFVEKSDLGTVVSAGYAMKLDAVRRGREPDLIFVRKENEKRLTDKFLDGPADIAVEIISPESVERDRSIKFAEYETAGIAEYWLIDPAQREAEFFILGDDGTYSPIPLDGGVFRSQVMTGFFLHTDWLWAENHSTFAALTELGMIG